MAVKVKNYAVVQLPVKDLEASVKWYREVLELPFSFEFSPEDNDAWFNVGGIGLGLIRCPNVPRMEFIDSVGQLQPIVSLQVDNIHDVYQEIKDKGIEVSDMSYKKSGGYSFTLRDPDGHLAHLWGGWPSEEDEAANS